MLLITEYTYITQQYIFKSTGGQDSVRGYRQDYLLTENGAVVSAEVQVPILHLPQINSTLQVVPFVDFGVGWNSSGRENPVVLVTRRSLHRSS